MYKNQKGFSHIIIPIVLLVTLAIVGVFAFSRINHADQSKGMFTAKNYGVIFRGTSDGRYVYQYSLDVSYGDSFDPKSDCPAQLDGFQGKLSIDYQSNSKARVSVLQNIKPYQSKDNNISAHACPDVVVPAFTKNIRLDKKWIESGSPDKTVQINNKTYNLALNEQARTIGFNSESYKQVEPYLPDGLAQLYAYPMYDNCMSTAQLQTYAKEHSIVEADSKYPGLTASIKSIPNLKLEAPDGSTNVLLVMTDDYVKQLIEKTHNERGVQENCRVVASKPVYTFVSP
jgi:hypothetical protein